MLGGIKGIVSVRDLSMTLESTASQLLCQKFYGIFRNLQIKIASRIWLRKKKNLVKKVENSLGIKEGKFADILFLDLASVLLKEGGKSNTYLAANSSNCCSSADPLSSRCHDSIND